eukprot:Nitzschia sp. Nitz4//scaffold232_size35869//2212//3840//NITZ4_007802-RA/size35869-processed-gene-0.1-mRNA-1//1//CDS//3329543315//3794//frame0
MDGTTLDKLAARAPDASWTSAFQAACWITPLYFVTDNVDEHDDSEWENMSQESLLQKQEREEVFGWTLDATARGVAVMGTAVFVSSELLRLAKEAAGCLMGEGDEVVECDESFRVYGMRPSSVLANIVTAVGLLSAIVMPLIGSFIDHTPYRRAVGGVSAAVMTVAILVQMLVLESYWFVAAILQVFVAFSYSVHLCAVYAYLPELTTNQETMVQYTAQFAAAQYGGSVVFLLFTVVLLYMIQQHNWYINPAAFSQSLVVLVCSVFFGIAWTRLFRPRPAAQTIPLHGTLLTAGVLNLYETCRTILYNHAAIKWFLLSVACVEAATTAFSTIAITYMTDQLGFTASENGIAILILLVCGLPGTRLAAWVSTRYNPKRSLQLCLLLWIVNTTLAAIFLRGPNQQRLTYFFAMIWGLAMGWIYPSENTLYVTIIPKGHEAELMGVFICASQVLAWLPPMVFSIMNEFGFSLQVGMFALTGYFFLSLAILTAWLGDYNDAVLHAKQVDEGILPYGFCSDALGIDGCGFYEEWLEGEVNEIKKSIT